MSEHLHAVILAGGRGTRFWPLSTRRRPKQFLHILGARTMLEETVDRLAPLIPADRLWVVAGEEQAAEVAAQIPTLDRSRLLVEPSGRNTAPAIGLAAAHLTALDPDAVMAVLPADHAVADPAAFRTALTAAAAAAVAEPVLVALGVGPTRAETGYGYIERGEVTGSFGGARFHRVAAFHEKPDQATAERYLASGGFAWNAGIFVWRARVVLEEIAAHLPDLAAALADLAPGGEAAAQAARRRAAYERIEPISIDYGVLERSKRSWMLPVDCGWNDVGSWSAVHDIGPADREGNVLRGEVVVIDAKDTLVGTEGPLVAVVGVEGVVVIATRDAVLVCARDRAQEVRRVVEELERRGRDDLV